jgi:spore germination protein
MKGDILMQIYVVQHGDSLWTISQRYGVNMTSIASANQLPNPNQLVIGQALVIPVADRYHTVQPGESLWVIAKHYGISVHDLMQVNRIVNPAHIQPGLVLVIPARVKPTTYVNAYLDQMLAPGQQIVQEVGEYLTYLSPFSYQVRSDGSFIPLKDAEVLQTAREKHDTPLMVITNFEGGTFKSEIARAIFTSTTAQDKLLASVIDTMKSKGYQGLTIDFEYIYPDDREKYNQFLAKVVDKLHPLGYSVSTALAPKQSSEQKGLLYEAHDYPVHGKLADFVILMTYEWGWAGGPPMAVAPINQVRKVLDYAVTVIPRNKIMMGAPLYGYDWTLPYVRGQSWAPTISPQEAIRRAAKYGAAIQYDHLAQSPFFHYFDEQGREHEVWFEDARSAQVKFDTLKEYQLRGISYWVLGNPFPQNWLVLADNFQIRKLT